MVTINVLDLRVNTIRKNSEELAYGIPHVFSTCAVLEGKKCEVMS